MLSADQVRRFGTDGFVVVEGFTGTDERKRLRRRAEEIVTQWEPSDARSVFTTNEQARRSDREFLDSGSSTWCFFEEQALDDNHELVTDKLLAINKIGHAQHDLDDEFRAFSYSPKLAEVADDLGLDNPMALQSMYIFKQPHIGGEVGCHQDATFLYTEPVTVTGFWFAIEDATVDNGCMWAAPGGHDGTLRQLFQRDDKAHPADADGTIFERLDDDPLPTPPPAGHELVPLEVPAGTLVVLHGLLPHWSDVNRSPVSRHAYTLHCISASAHYPDWNWLQRPPEMPLRPLGSVGA